MSPQNLGSFLRDTRKEKKISMRALADAAAISVAYVSKIEHGEANPTIDVLERLAKALGISVSDLTLFARQNDVAMLNLPESLKKFIDKYDSEYPQLRDPEYQRMLSGIRFRGRYPQKSGDWLAIFNGIRLVLDRE